MLPITIKANELFDDNTGEFIAVKEQTLQLEHSLVSLSKWESKWHKPFLDTLEKGLLTLDETIDYIKFMTLTPNVNENVYKFIDQSHMNEINKYISNPMTATTFSKTNTSGSKEIVTAELIYYSMIALNIPFECQKWHLNRLLTLIKVCNIKNQPPKKMSRSELMSRNAALNAARRKQLNTKG